MARTEITLFPRPGTYLGRPLTIPVGSDFFGRWSEIRSWAAWQFDADETEIDTLEIFWGGPDADDNSREALIVKGEIVGVFSDPLTADEWQDMLAADAAEYCGSLNEQVRAAARARAAHSHH